MLAEAHADAAAVMQADPCRAAGGVQKRIQERPVADRVAAILHRLGFAVGARHGTGVQMIAPDHNGRLQLACAHHFVEGQPRLVPLSQPDPANPRRQPLKRDAVLRHVQPLMQVGVVGKKLLHLGIGAVDILGIARQRTPAERPHTPTEQRPDIRGHEAGEGKGVFQTLLKRHLPDVVAIVERGNTGVPEIHHRLHMHLHAGARGFLHRLRVGLLLGTPFGHAPTLRQIAMHRIMRAGLVGDDIGLHAAPHQFGENIRRVADQAHGFRLTRLGPAVDHLKRLIKVACDLIKVSRALAELCPGLVAFHGQTARPGKDRRQRLRAPHAAKSPGQDPPTRQIAVVMLPSGLGKGLERALHDTLSADIDPRPGGHLAVHHQALAIELAEMIPVGPVRHEVGIGDQNPGRIRVGLEHTHRLARLHQQGLVRLQPFQRGDDLVEILPRPRRAPDAAINDQFMRVLGHVGVQVVHQHPHRRLGDPMLGTDLGTGVGIDVAGVVAGVGHDSSPSRASASRRPSSDLRWTRMRSARAWS